MNPENIPLESEGSKQKSSLEKPQPKIDSKTIEVSFDRVERMRNSNFPEQEIKENQIMKFKIQTKEGKIIECGLGIKDGNGFLIIGKNQLKLNQNGTKVNGMKFTKDDFIISSDFMNQTSKLPRFMDEVDKRNEILNSKI